jgi:hypothetical protein
MPQEEIAAIRHADDNISDGLTAREMFLNVRSLRHGLTPDPDTQCA